MTAMPLPPLPAWIWLFPARLERIIDGDSCILEVDLGFDLQITKRFRLLHVDAPEKRGTTRLAGLAAEDYVKLWLLVHGADGADWPLEIETCKDREHDSFGRYLAIVRDRRTGDTLSIDLLDAGHAVPYKE